MGWSLVRLGVAERARQRSLEAHGVSCVSFHDPDPVLFERCVRWLLGNGFVLVSEKDVIDAARRGVSPPRGAVWLSLDDGWRGNMRLLPVIERYRVPITIFLVTDAVERSGVFWWTCVYGHRSELPGPFRHRVLTLWDVPEAERRLLVEPVLERHARECPRQALTVDEVRRLGRSPFVAFGSHTVHHPALPRCDETQRKEELVDSRLAIESWTGARVASLAYPKNLFDGIAGDELADSGYELAVTVEERIYRPDRDEPYRVPRFVVGEDSYFSANICKMVGAWGPYADGMARFAALLRPGFRR